MHGQQIIKICSFNYAFLDRDFGLTVNLNLSPNVTTIMTGQGNNSILLASIKNYRKSTAPTQTRHTNRPSDIPVQKAKERKSNSEEQCTGVLISP